MMAAIAAILGFLSSVVPGVVQLFTLKENNAQQIRLEQLRQQGRREEIAGQVDVANAQADVQQSEHIYDYGAGASGYRFVDAMAVAVRPYITFVFFHFFLLIEGALFVYGVNQGYDLGQLAKLLWDDNTASIFAAIMGFWFGNRVIMRGQQAMAAMLSVSQKAKS